jgi:hypothetical protein
MLGLKGKGSKEKASISPIQNEENKKLSIESGLRKFPKWL